jgi:hypothetical protein
MDTGCIQYTVPCVKASREQRYAEYSVTPCSICLQARPAQPVNSNAAHCANMHSILLNACAVRSVGPRVHQVVLVVVARCRS